jgi:hypothetical protein
MKHGQLGHFLLYHLLPILLIYGGMLGLVGFLTYLHKSKKRKEKEGKKKPDKTQLLWQARPAKRRRRKK